MVKMTVIPNNAEMKEIVELRTDVGYAAPHEGSFWSTALLEHCFRFIQKTVGSRP